MLSPHAWSRTPPSPAVVRQRDHADERRGGGSVSGYTYGVASRHPRIQVPRDPELDRAIARARPTLGRRAPSSQIVHALALRGAHALEHDREAEARAREFLVSVADGTSGLDLERL